MQNHYIATWKNRSYRNMLERVSNIRGISEETFWPEIFQSAVAGFNCFWVFWLVQQLVTTNQIWLFLDVMCMPHA